MPHAITCSECGARFALPISLYERKVKGRVVTVRCRRCDEDITVDGVKLQAADTPNAPEELDEAAIESRPAQAPVDETPTVPLASSSVPPVKGLWLVSYSAHDDRELTAHQIARALRRKEIDTDTIVWRDGMDDWLPIAEVPELAKLLEPNETGGFVGTGSRLASGETALKAALTKARAKTEETEAGPFQSISSGTFGDQERPAPPERRRPARLRDDEPVDDDAPSSGTPDLRSLTTAAKQPSKAEARDERIDPALLGLGSGAITGIQLAPPAIDAPVTPETPDVEVEQPTKKPERRDSAAATSRSTTPDRRAERTPERRPGWAWGLLLSGLAAAAGFWVIRQQQERDPGPAANEPAAGAQAAPTPEPATTAASTPEPEASAEVEPEPSALPAPAEPPETSREQEPSPTPKDESKAPAEPAADKPEPKPAQPEPSEKSVELAPPFDTAAASSALSSAAAQASACRKEGDPSGTATVVVTFAPSGRVTSATVNGPPFAGTQTGGCIAATLRRARVPAFSGSHITVSKTVTIR